MGEENTNSLSYVTMRKHKKSSRNVVVNEYVDKTIGPSGEELNTITTPAPPNATNRVTHVGHVEPVPHVSGPKHAATNPKDVSGGTSSTTPTTTVNTTSVPIVQSNVATTPTYVGVTNATQVGPLQGEHDFIETMFGVSLKTLKDIDDFTTVSKRVNIRCGMIW